MEGVESKCSCKTKIKVFRATVENVLFYGAETWTQTAQLTSRIYGTYTNLLRKALNMSWKDYITNAEFYGELPPADAILRHRCLQFTGHVARCSGERYQPAADLVFWQNSSPMCRGQGNMRTYLKTIIQDLGGHMQIEDISKTAQDRDKWWTLIHLRK